MLKELLKIKDNILYRESLVSREHLVLLVTVDLLDLLGHLDLLDLLERRAERLELNISQISIFIILKITLPSNEFIMCNIIGKYISNIYLREPLDQMDPLVGTDLLESR